MSEIKKNPGWPLVWDSTDMPLTWAMLIEARYLEDFKEHGPNGVVMAMGHGPQWAVTTL